MDTSPFIDIYDSVGHLFRRTGQWVNVNYEQEIGEFGITISQLAVLIAVDDCEGLQQRELAEALHYDEATVAGIVRRLENLQLIKRQSSTRSSRGLAIYFTEEGKALFAKLRPRISKVEDELLLRNLTPDERVQLLTLLSKAMVVNNSFFPGPAAPADGKPSPAAKSRPKRTPK